MAKEKDLQLKSEEPQPENKPVPNDFSLHVMDAITKRGLAVGKFDQVKVIHLWDTNYRVNCHKDHKIAESYFVSFTNDEGILFSEPHLPLAKESL